MPAANEEFPWLSYHENYDYFENMLKNHSKIKDFQNKDCGLYEITLASDERLSLFICDCYSFGIAEYYETIDNIGELDIIIISSLWCSYAMDLKSYCMSNKIGLFKPKDFMAAIHNKQYWEYMNESEQDYFK